MEDLIFVSMENWDEIWRRNQFICAELSRRHPEKQILFLGIQRNVWHYLRRGQWRTLLKNPTWRVAGFPNICVTQALRIGPERLWLGRKINETLTRLHLRNVAKRLGIGPFVLWLNPHYGLHLAGKMGESAVVYDITDDWTCLSQEKGLANLIAQQDRTLCTKADVVIVCSSRLYEVKVDIARRLELIPNGVDANHYAGVLDSSLPAPEASNGWAKPVLGYTGTIHSDRVDVQLVVSLAERFPTGTIVLVGPEMLNSQDRAMLRNISNVVLSGPVPYAQIPNYMRTFDVCIVPHRMTGFTESLNPIKLWEYLAAGKPIVSTNVAGFRDYPEFVRLAENADQFTDQIRAALSEGSDLAQPRRAEARKHSWSSRVDAIEKVLQSCTPTAGAV